MRWRKTLPLVISLGLIAWLASRISLGEVLQAAVLLPWQKLAPMTVGLVVALYLWDALCLLTVFSTAAEDLTYVRMLQLRGKSYLVGALNQGLGQAAVAWHVAKMRQSSLRTSLTGSIILSWHEGLILSAMALIGSWSVENAHLAQTRWFCASLFAALVAAAVLLRFLPHNMRGRLDQSPWGAALPAWDFRRSLRLIALRTVYFAIAGFYLVAALWLCGQSISLTTALAVVPLVLMATVLPSASGLGTRETALYLLLPSKRPNVVVAIGILWSTGVILLRLLIGLGWMWFDRGSMSLVPVSQRALEEGSSSATSLSSRTTSRADRACQQL